MIASLFSAFSLVAAIVLVILAVPAYLLYTVRMARGPRGPRAAYLFITILIGVIVGFMSVRQLASAAGQAIADPPSGPCAQPTSLRLAQEGTPPPEPTTPPLPTVAPIPVPEFTAPPVPSPTTFPFPIPTPPAFSFPPIPIPSPPASPANPFDFGVEPCREGQARDAAPATAAHGGVMLLASVGVIVFHARAARRLLDEEV